MFSRLQFVRRGLFLGQEQGIRPVANGEAQSRLADTSEGEVVACSFRRHAPTRTGATAEGALASAEGRTALGLVQLVDVSFSRLQTHLTGAHAVATTICDRSLRNLNLNTKAMHYKDT